MTLSTSAVAVCCCSDSTQLVEQSRVLDGDDGLSGEVLDQLNLLVGERADLLAIDENGADQLVILQHWHLDQGPRAAKFDVATLGIPSAAEVSNMTTCFVRRTIKVTALQW